MALLRSLVASKITSICSSALDLFIRFQNIMRDLKKDSTNWVKENFEYRFAWQEGYAAFTVSPSAVSGAALCC
jgi:hypothetical protein